MKIADLMILLRADGAQFTKGLNSAERSLQKSVGNMEKKALGLAKMFAGGLGVAGFTAIVDKTIHASQTMGDAFDNAMVTAKTSVDTFFNALSTGNWSAFEGGLRNLISLSKEYAESLDQLESRVISHDWVIATDMPVYRDAMNDARNTELSAKERADALKKANEILAKMRASAEKYKEDSYREIKDWVGKSTGKEIDDDTVDILLDRLFRSTIVGDDEKFKTYLQEYKTLVKANTTTLPSLIGPYDIVDKDAVRSGLIKRFGDNTDLYEFLRILSEQTDDELQKQADIALKAKDVLGIIQGEDRAMNKVTASINKVSKKELKPSGTAADNGVVAMKILPEIDTTGFDEQAITNRGLVGLMFEESQHLYLDKDGNICSEIVVAPKVDIETKDIDTKSATQKIADVSKNFTDEMNTMLSESLSNGITEAFSAVGTLIVDGDGSGFLNSIEQFFADILNSVGKLCIKYGVAMLGLQEALKAAITNPLGLLIIGGALVATAAGLKADIEARQQKTPALANGGLAYAPTLAVVGDNPRAAIDPEVIAPLSKLKGIIGASQSMSPNVNLNGRLALTGSDIRFVLDNYDKQLSIARG